MRDSAPCASYARTPAADGLYARIRTCTPTSRRAGGLRAALAAVAAGQGLDLGETRAPTGVERLLTASMDAERGAYTITTAASERFFQIQAWSRGVLLLGGGTPDLLAVARAADAWRGGARLRRIRQRCPFVTFDGLAEAHERGPADAVTAQWEELRRDCPEPTRDVLAAAYAEPRLRQLFPVIGQCVLGFSRCTGYPYVRAGLSVEPLEGGRHRVFGPYDEMISATAAEAVALVVRHLPGGCGPAVAGSAEEP